MAFSKIKACWLLPTCLLLLTKSFSNALSAQGRLDTTGVASQSPQKVIPSVKVFDMGEDKLVDVFVSPKERVRPSSLALARMIAHCPSLIEGKNVLELNCGIGLISATACKHARPNHVAVSDKDPDVLALAYTSCTRLQKSRASVSRCKMDWKDKSTWPNQLYHVLLAADVLKQPTSVLPLTAVLKSYLASGDEDFRKRALIVDPVEQRNRDAFCYAANKAGLDVEVCPFPGMDDFVLLDVFSRD